jgi:DNA-binding LytR/AlgR family response regulator
MKIAICDDEPQDLEQLKRYCQRYDPTLKLGLFADGQQLLDAFQKDFYDIILLDIQMEQPDGLVVGQRLMQQPRKPLIVFVTNSPAYATRGYGLAVRYLCKPLAYEKFASTLETVQSRVQMERLLICCEREQVVVRMEDILFVEVLSHSLLFHMKDGQVYTERGSLATVMARLPSKQFVQTHKSFCVNLDYVQRASYDMVTLTDGSRVPLSRSKTADFRDRLAQFVLAKNAMA